MTHHITIQQMVNEPRLPTKTSLRQWAMLALSKKVPQAVNIRIVGLEEITMLNETYRKKHGPTNVLSFPIELPPTVNMKRRPLGDVVICAAIVASEATAQHKSLPAHWAHMTIHGILHLQGYDHQNEADAAQMEQLEITLLKKLKFPNPYQHGASTPHDHG